jgi:hypothetical protein
VKSISRGRIIQKGKFRITSESASDIIVFVLIYWFLLGYFNPALLLSANTATGGDMVSHNYLLYYLKEHLLPRLDILGWTPDWYAGMPLFQFYFPLPYLMMTALSYVLPLQASFKLVTVLGIFSLPAVVYLAMKWIGFEFPTPIMAAVLTLPFLYTEEFMRWGGNIKSTLAGQISYSLSLSLAMLFFGLIWLGVRNRRHALLCAVLVGMITISHVFTLSFIISSSLYFLIKKRWMQAGGNLKYLASVFILGFMLSAFWLLPMADKVQYTSPIGWKSGWGSGDPFKLISSGYGGEYFPLSPLHIFTLIGLFFGMKDRDERILYLGFSAIIAIVMFLVIPAEALYTVRFLVPLYLMLMLIAAYGITRALSWAKMPELMPLVLFLYTASVINHPLTPAEPITDLSRYTDWSQHAPLQGWINWNYEGMEAKNSYNTFKGINDFLGNLPPGRVLNEYSTQDNVFGSERSLEDIPMYSHQPVLKGLLMDSGLSTYFIFYMWSEISKNPACPMAEAGCSSFNIDRGTEHLKMFNTRYVIAITDKLRYSLKNDSRYTLLKEFIDPPSGQTFDIFELKNDYSYAYVPKYKPVNVRTSNWRKISLNWFRQGDRLEIPLVFINRPDDYDKAHFSLEANDSLDYIPAEETNANCSIAERLLDDQILIKTTCIGQPVIVKMTYFPNWKVEGADKVYLVSPSFMLIYPTQENVRLYYGQTPSNMIGWALTILGASMVVFLTCIRFGLINKPKFPKRALKSTAKYRRLTSRYAATLKPLIPPPRAIRRFIQKIRRHQMMVLLGVLVIVAVAYALYQPHETNLTSPFKPYNVMQIDSLDVVSRSDEQAHNYSVTGETASLTRTYSYPDGTNATDDGRGFRGYEKFEVRSRPGTPLILVRRIDHSVPDQVLEVYANNRYVGNMASPDIDSIHPWRDVTITIPAGYITSAKTTLNLRYQSGSPDANSFHYWVFA